MAALAAPGLDSGITTSAWQSYMKHVKADDDDDIISDEEEEICTIFGGPPEPERDAIAKRREWMAIVQQRLEASAEPIYPRVKLAPNESAAAPLRQAGLLPRPRPHASPTPACTLRTASLQHRPLLGQLLLPRRPAASRPRRWCRRQWARTGCLRRAPT